MGTSPRASDSTFSWTMSRTWTWWPSSEKQAAVTRPTQPAPMTPIGWRSGMTGEATHGVQPWSSESLGRARDFQHLLLGQRLEQRVRHPVHRLRRSPGHEPHPVAVHVDVVLAAPDLLGLVCALEDRRVLPLRAL